jgi:hypothetical protein
VPVSTIFYDGHPPLMVTAEEAPPKRSEYLVVGTVTIKGDDMNRVTDPNYPWKEFASNGSPAYRKKANEIHATLVKEVDSYLLIRRRYWEQIQRFEYPADTEITVTKHRGITEHHTHTVEQSHNTTTRIAADLDLDLSPQGAIPPEVPPVLAASTNSAVGGGPGGDTTGLHFSHEVTDTLHITDTHDTTYTDEETDSYRVTYKGGITYIRWQLKDECLVQRKRKTESTSDEEPVSIVSAVETEYTQAFDPKTGDIN